MHKEGRRAGGQEDRRAEGQESRRAGEQEGRATGGQEGPEDRAGSGAEENPSGGSPEAHWADTCDRAPKTPFHSLRARPPGQGAREVRKEMGGGKGREIYKETTLAARSGN